MTDCTEKSDNEIITKVIKEKDIEDDDVINFSSNDGLKFPILKKVACQSKLIETFLSPQVKSKEYLEREIKFDKFNGKIVEKLVEFLQYKYKYEIEEPTCTPLPFDIDPEINVNLLLAADFLDI